MSDIPDIRLPNFELELVISIENELWNNHLANRNVAFMLRDITDSHSNQTGFAGTTIFDTFVENINTQSNQRNNAVQQQYVKWFNIVQFDNGLRNILTNFIQNEANGICNQVAQRLRLRYAREFEDNCYTIPSGISGEDNNRRAQAFIDGFIRRFYRLSKHGVVFPPLNKRELGSYIQR